MEYLIKIVLFFSLFFSLLLNALGLGAQNYPCYLYGSITTVDGDVYEGPIRWNDEEVFLTDVFNSQKIENPYLKYLDEEKPQIVEYKKRRRTSWYRVEYSNGSTNQSLIRKFECRFGDINSISVTGSESVNLELKTGKFINLKGGSNDVGNQVWIMDHELGLLKIDWNRIDVVNFFRPENQIQENFGNPIYGKITTTIGEFTGFIQWDHDERLLQDKLDGLSRDGDMNIPFAKIKEIKKQENGSLITLQSGRELHLKSSNDVSRSNRGIIVTIPQVGRIDFTWKHFLSLEIIALPQNVVNCFSEFKDSERLYGKLTTKEGKTFEGVIVYDLDEAMDSEVLNGLNDKLEFSIPFRNVKKITPKAYNYCLVELKSGQNLYLGDQTDVSGKNAGILIFTGNDQYEIIDWDDLEEIEFM
ncbi:hypothetical protein [Marinifilum caeruleilacunae]|uniref:Uncharacterized protein n=1 Tax=Marinifilum caeruleilacunae TaxID=2499076 RepID=A0ABX1WYV7_9BACT|nr:hypothetical protein [Marinifilum caeruleilacunae]NOU61333.1 hypothetical protein [Marinifilum caeruleilacunae]